MRFLLSIALATIALMGCPPLNNPSQSTLDGVWSGRIWQNNQAVTDLGFAEFSGNDIIVTYRGKTYRGSWQEVTSGGMNLFSQDLNRSFPSIYKIQDGTLSIAIGDETRPTATQFLKEVGPVFISEAHMTKQALYREMWDTVKILASAALRAKC
jgi:hypothetical protein